MASDVFATPPAGADRARPRRGYIDWLRGLAVIVMIEAHTFDAWTAQPSRETLAFWYVQLIAGWGAPIFLFLAGLSIALASGARVRRTCADEGKSIPLTPPAPRSPLLDPGKGERGEDAVGRLAGGFSSGFGVAPAAEERARAFEASKAMIWRGVQIFALALLFRIQAWALSPGATVYGILKVDILNVMGPAIGGAALVWGLVPRTGPRLAALALATAFFGLLTPIVRSAGWIAALPDPIEWYFRPWPGCTTFTFFPWAGFVFAGTAVGVLLDRVRSAPEEGRMNLRFAAAGALIVATAFAASFLPSPYAQSYFWTSSPCFFFLRVGVLVLFLSLAYVWVQRPWARGRPAPAWSPLQQFGRTSLFIYWIHVEMVYGILSYPLHRALTLPQACVAFVLFTIAMYGCSVLKTRIATRWRDRRRNRDRDPTSQNSTLVVGGRSA